VPGTSLRIRCGMFSMHFAITRNLCMMFELASDWFVIMIFSGVKRSITGTVRCSCKLDLVCSECLSLPVLTSIIRKHRCSPMQV